MSTITSKSKLGVIAGFGDFPREVCERAKVRGYEVSLCGVEGEADPELENIADNVTWVKLGEIGKLLKFFNQYEIKQAILCGKIHKVNILSGKVIPDLDTLQMLVGVRNFKDKSLLEAFCSYLGKKGIEIVDSTLFLNDSLHSEGPLTRLKPTKSQLEDIEFGFKIAKEIAGLDIGQTVVVKNKSVVAVESIEGTDETILRGGRWVEKGSVVVKVARPNQDMRFDVPTIGPSTIEACQKANVSCLAFEARKTIVLYPKKVIETANKQGIVLFAYKER